MKRFAFLIPAFIILWELAAVLRAPAILEATIVPLWHQTGAHYLAGIFGFRHAWVTVVTLGLVAVLFAVPMWAVFKLWRLILKRRPFKHLLTRVNFR